MKSFQDARSPEYGDWIETGLVDDHIEGKRLLLHTRRWSSPVA